MAKFIARLVVTLAVLYAGAAGVFAWLHYEGTRPAVPQVLTDFHAWTVSLIATKKAERPPRPVEDAPPPKPPAPPPAPPVEPPPPAPKDPETQALDTVEKDLLPKALELAKQLREMDRGTGEEFEKIRTDALAELGKAREVLNPILEKDAHNTRANRLWTKVQELYATLKKL